MAATKKYPDYGGVLTVRQSLYHAVHDYDGGLPVLAALYGWNAATMRNKLNLRMPDPAPTLKDFEQILEATRDPRILTAICEPVGAVWRFADEVNDVPGDLDVLSRGTALMTSASGVIDELVKALDDGEIDAVEMARLRQRFFELQQEIQATTQTAERFEVKG